MKLFSVFLSFSVSFFTTDILFSLFDQYFKHQVYHWKKKYWIFVEYDVKVFPEGCSQCEYIKVNSTKSFDICHKKANAREMTNVNVKRTNFYKYNWVYNKIYLYNNKMLHERYLVNISFCLFFGSLLYDDLRNA